MPAQFILLFFLLCASPFSRIVPIRLTPRICRVTHCVCVYDVSFLISRPRTMSRAIRRQLTSLRTTVTAGDIPTHSRSHGNNSRRPKTSMLLRTVLYVWQSLPNSCPRLNFVSSALQHQRLSIRQKKNIELQARSAPEHPYARARAWITCFLTMDIVAKKKKGSLDRVRRAPAPTVHHTARDRGARAKHSRAPTRDRRRFNDVSDATPPIASNERRISCTSRR
jgi:hypothetical protein